MQLRLRLDHPFEVIYPFPIKMKVSLKRLNWKLKELLFLHSFNFITKLSLLSFVFLLLLMAFKFPVRLVGHRNYFDSFSLSILHRQSMNLISFVNSNIQFHFLGHLQIYFSINQVISYLPKIFTPLLLSLFWFLLRLINKFINPFCFLVKLMQCFIKF